MAVESYGVGSCGAEAVPYCWECFVAVLEHLGEVRAFDNPVVVDLVPNNCENLDAGVLMWHLTRISAYLQGFGDFEAGTVDCDDHHLPDSLVGLYDEPVRRAIEIQWGQRSQTNCEGRPYCLHLSD